jgi:hypothetical protein
MKGTRSSIVPRGVDRARAEGAKERSVLWVFNRGLKGARGSTVEHENLRKAPGKQRIAQLQWAALQQRRRGHRV